MNKIILTAVIVGLITGLVVGFLLKGVPAIDNLIADQYNSLITGGIAGAIAAFVIVRNKRT